MLWRHQNQDMSGRRDGAWARRGAVVLVLALLVASAAVVLDLTASDSAGTTGEIMGFSPGGAFPYRPSDEVSSDVDTMAASGGRWVRVDVDWQQVEPVHGRFEWRELDDTVAAAQDAGLSIIGLVSYTPAWARPPGTPKTYPPSDPRAFAAFAEEAARRYATSIGTWEVWNEPNLVTFWASNPDVGRYARLLEMTSAAIRAGAPGSVVLSGGLAAVPDLAPARIDAVTFLRGLYDLGAGAAFDGVSVHPYTYPTLPSADPDGLFRRLSDVHELMSARGDAAKGVWITEFGAPTFEGPRGVTPEQQSRILADGLSVARGMPWVRSFLVYSLRDAGTDPGYDEHHFGLRTYINAPKPAWDVFVGEAGRQWRADSMR